MKLLAVFIFWISLPSFAKIITANSLQDIRPFLFSQSPQTLVTWDIDDTVGTAEQFLGSEDWYEQQVQNYESQHFEWADAIRLANRDWETIHHHTWMKPVDQQIGETIRLLKQSVPTIGLTARSSSLMARSFQQLAKLNVDFRSSNASLDPSFVLPNQAVFARGILFVGPNAGKGTTLKEWFSKIQWRPKRVILIDDMLYNHENMQRVLSELGIEYIGIHFTAVRQQVQCSTKLAGPPHSLGHHGAMRQFPKGS